MKEEKLKYVVLFVSERENGVNRRKREGCAKSTFILFGFSFLPFHSVI